MAGAMTAATLVPELKKLAAKARSRCGNQAAADLMHAGKLPPSPAPSAMRAKRKPRTLPTKPCAMAARLQQMIETV